eukprot:527181-Rhodomonas_salina.2
MGRNLAMAPLESTHSTTRCHASGHCSVSVPDQSDPTHTHHASTRELHSSNSRGCQVTATETDTSADAIDG